MHEQLEQAVRHVVTALNIDPADFQLPDGFERRAELRGVGLLALNGIERQLVFVGRAPDAGTAAATALETLPSAAREACEQLVVAWTDASGTPLVVVHGLAADGGLGPLVATSWEPPDRWRVPALGERSDGAIDTALGRVEAVVARRAGAYGFDAELERALGLVDLELRQRGGEGQATRRRPPSDADDASWRTWLDRYARSVRAIWQRVGGDGGDGGAVLGIVQPTVSGPLSGTSVFLSYALPDATELAWPVRDALAAAGATIWFDQFESLDPARLDAGLGDAIAGCDAFVMCASDEFVERAGYATQEVAWALEHAARLRLVVVSTPDAVLPTVVAGWPQVALADDPAGLRQRLVAALDGAPVPEVRVPARIGAVDPTALAPEADVAALLLRVAHARRFKDIDQEMLAAIAGTDRDDRPAAALRRRLISIGENLDWDGTLADVGAWPDDSFVRDFRLRLASARVIASTRSPLNRDFHDPTPVSDDLERLATRRLPLLDWPAQPGWAELERSYALRFVAGVLRNLEQMLDAGHMGGIVNAWSAVRAWVPELRERRRECYDALVELRMQGRLPWTTAPPDWHSLQEAWVQALTRSTARWSGTVPSETFVAVLGDMEAVAAVGAQTTWCAARHGGLAVQSCTLPRTKAQVVVYTAAMGASPPEAGGSLRLGLGPAPVLTLHWDGGEATRPIPAVLAHCVS